MSTTYARTVLKSFNPGRLREELEAIQAGLHCRLKGFLTMAPRRCDPAPARQKIGQSVTNGVLVESFADPGELEVKSLTSLTTGEEAAVDAAIAAHDHTQLSQSQGLDDQDTADYDTLLLAYQNWSGLTDAQFKGAMKILLRVLHRRFKGSLI